MLLTTLFFAVLLHINSAEQSSFSRTYEFPEPRIESYWAMRNNNHLYYARCNSSQLGSSRDCVVGLKFDAFEDSTRELTKECKISLKPEMANAVVNDSFQVEAFGKDKILVLWIESQSAIDAGNQKGSSILKTTVVHMFDNCQTFETTVHKSSDQVFVFNCASYPTVVTFEDSYEVLLKNVVTECTSDSKCSSGYGIYKFDSYCRKLSGPEYWTNTTPLVNASFFVISAAFKQPKQGYFISTSDDKNLIVELEDKESENHKRLQIWKTTCNKLPSIYRMSLTNEAIGLCYLCGNSSFSCWLANQKGEMKVNSQFTLDGPYKAMFSAMYNTRNGGYLIAMINSTQSDYHTHDNYRLIKVDAKNQIESMKVKFDTECNHDSGTSIIRMFENKRDQYCIVRLCQSDGTKPSGRLESSVRCYSADEFSKCMDCL